MRPTHSQMIMLSDDMRANIAGVPALIVSGILVLGFDFDPLGSGATVAAPLALPFEVFNLFLVFWPLFALTYLLWTPRRAERPRRDRAHRLFPVGDGEPPQVVVEVVRHGRCGLVGDDGRLLRVPPQHLPRHL